MSPEELAEILYEKYCNLFEDKYKVDPKIIAIAEQVVVIENELENCDGKLISDGNGVNLIMINKNLKEETSKRFTIAHELGHYEISKHRSVLQHGFNVSSFKLNYNPTSFQEKEANEFASSLLMPKKLFREITDQLEINSQTIKKISDKFNVSLTAASLRYLKIGKKTICVIKVKDKKIEWAFCNDNFKLKYIKRGQTILRESEGWKYFNNKDSFTEGPALINASVWFYNDNNLRNDFYIYEDVIPLPSYNSVLIILWEYEGP